MGELKTVLPDIEFWKGMIPCQAACPIRTDAGKYRSSLRKAHTKTPTWWRDRPTRWPPCAAACVLPPAKTVAGEAKSMRR